MAVRVFWMNDTEWWIHDGSAADLLDKYVDEIGITHADYCEAREDHDPESLPIALSERELDRKRFYVDAGPSRTFREQLAIEVRRGGPYPRIFASNEY